MLSLFSVVGLALYAQTITSLPTLPSSNDAGLSAHLDLDANQFSTVGTDPGGALFPSLDESSSDDAETLLSQQLALNVGSSASTPPALASQNYPYLPGCDKAPKGKRDTGGAETSFCPAYPTNFSPSGAAQEAPQKNPEGQQRQQQNSAPQEPTNAKPRKPGTRGNLRLTPSDEPVRNPFGEKNKDRQCPRQYKYTVCGISELRYLNLVASLTIHDADLVINSGFGFGMVVRSAWKGHAGIAGWTDALEECGPDPRKIYCCSIYLPESRQAYSCETIESARRSEQCWKGVVGLPSQTVLNCIENL